MSGSRRLRGSMVLLALLLVGTAASGQGLSERAKRAAQSGNLPGLTEVVRETAEILGADDALPVGRLDQALTALETAQSGLTSLREQRENAAGDDDAALDALYGSNEWMRMDHLTAEIDYWRGWVLYRLGEHAIRSGAAKTQQRNYLQQSLRSFGRALPQMRDPATGRETLLAVASLQRMLGSHGKAETTLDQLEKVFADAPEDFRSRVRLERVRTAAASGNLDDVVRLTEAATTASERGRTLLLLRLEALLASQGDAARDRAIGGTARALVAGGGRSAAEAVAHLAAAGLPPKTLSSLGLEAVGDALVGLATLDDDPDGAAASLERALRGGGPLPGLRGDVLWARVAEARFRAGRPDLAYAACLSFREAHPKSSFVPDVARLAYDAARAWQQESPGGRADRAVSEASRWVARDAPGSAEAGEVAVHRALSRAAAASSPERAIRILERASPKGGGGEAVELQKALLLSGQLQLALEGSLQQPTDVRGPARKLRAALAQARRGDPKLIANYRQDLGLADARLLIASGQSGKALTALLNQRADFESARARLVALWKVGRRADAQDRARRLLAQGPGDRTSRWQLAAIFAAVDPSRAPNPRVHAALFAELRKHQPGGIDSEIVADLGVREAQALQRGGQGDRALERLDEVLAADPRALGTLAKVATLYEALGLPDRATEVWHHTSQLAPDGSDAWTAARVGVARTLRAAPGRADDGCAVAQSLLASGREFPDGARAELDDIAASCASAS